MQSNTISCSVNELSKMSVAWFSAEHLKARKTGCLGHLPFIFKSIINLCQLGLFILLSFILCLSGCSPAIILPSLMFPIVLRVPLHLGLHWRIQQWKKNMSVIVELIATAGKLSLQNPQTLEENRNKTE